jgi:hypothetical protein
MIAAAAADDCFGGLFPRELELPILRASGGSPGPSMLRSALIKPKFELWDDLFSIRKLNQ